MSVTLIVAICIVKATVSLDKKHLDFQAYLSTNLNLDGVCFLKAIIIFLAVMMLGKRQPFLTFKNFLKFRLSQPTSELPRCTEFLFMMT